MTRTYSHLMSLPDYNDRFDYLKIKGAVGEPTFGWARYLNQVFYRSRAWRRVRDHVIVRDSGYDLAHPDHPIPGKILVHHMNPITEEDLDSRNPDILDPEFLIAVSHETHNAIHFGLDRPPIPTFVERRPNDMIPWR